MSEETTVTVNYAGNSLRKRELEAETTKPENAERPRRVEKIEGVVAEKRKKPLSRKIAETFSGESAEDVGQFVLMEVVIPSLKTLIYEAFTKGLDRTLFGGGAPRRGSSPLSRGRGPQPYTAYNRVSPVAPRRDDPPEISRRARNTHDFSEILIHERGTAEEAVERLRDLISEYGSAKVADLYDALGISEDFPDYNWGWTDLRSARVMATRGGFYLDLPRPVQVGA